MHGRFGNLEASHFVAFYPAQEPLASPHEDRRHDQVQLVEEPGSPEGPDRGDAAVDLDVLAAGRGLGSLQDLFRRTVDEVEGGAVLELQVGPGMVRQHEDRVLEGRSVAPPALPVLVGPGAAEGAEHVAAHDGGAHALEGPGRVAVVQPRAAPLDADHGLEGAGGEEPVHDLDGVLAERLGLALLKAGSETIQGTAEGANHDFRYADWIISRHHEPPGI